MSGKISLTTDKSGKLIQNIDNAIRIFENDADLKGVFAFHERANLIYKVKDAPWDDEKNSKPRSITDTDLDKIYHYFENYGFMNQKKIESALRIVADKNKFEPLRDYFLSREGKYDGQPRVDRYFIDMLEAPDTPYIREATRLFFVSIVARTFYPGIKYDYCPILTGGQGIGKSKCCEAILPSADYFSNDLPTTALRDSRKFLESTQGKSIIEIAELTTFRKSELEEVKQCITTQVDRGRLAWGKVVQEVPRRFVFIGTTNQVEFLRDATGNRRFLPIKCNRKAETVNPLLFSNDFEGYRDQLWSEAVQIFREYEKNGLHLILSKEVQDEVKIAQGEALEVDDWSELIDRYIYTQLMPSKIKGKKDSDQVSIDLSTLFIYKIVLEGETRNIDRPTSLRIGNYFLKNSDLWQKVSTVRLGDYRGRGYRLSGSVAYFKELIAKYETDDRGFRLLSDAKCESFEQQTFAT